MKISTKGRYALRLMLDLALYSRRAAAVPLRDVADRQEISDKYLEQIVTQLSRAGLVRSIRGAGGGYLLTRAPEQYTVGEILAGSGGHSVPGELCRRHRLLQPGGPLRDCGGLAGDSGRRGWGGGPHYPVRPGGPLSQKVRSPEGIGTHTTAARCIADAPRRFCFRSAPAGAPAATAARS